MKTLSFHSRKPQRSHFKRILRFGVAITALCTGALACSSDSKSKAPQAKRSSVTLLTTSETKDALDSFFSRSEGSITTPLGNVIVVKSVSVEGPKALKESLVSKDTNATLLVAPSDSMMDALNDSIAAATGSIIDCQSLFYSPLVAAYRSSDLFSFTQVDDPVDLGSLFPVGGGEDGKALPWVLIPHPLSSVAGLNTLLGIAASVSHRAPSALTPDALRLNAEGIRSIQSRVRLYPFSDRRTLHWLQRQEGGLPLLALTTKQQFSAFMAEKPDSGLQMHPIQGAALSNNYPICVISAPWVTQDDRTAAIAVQQALLGAARGDAFKKFGFSQTPPQGQLGSPDRMPTSIASPLLSNWYDFSKGTAPTIVVDTSVSMEGERISTLRGGLALFLSSLGTGRIRAPVSIVQFQSSASALTTFSTDPIVVQAALAQLKPSGASAFRDGIMRAVELYTDQAVPGLRRPIIAFVDGKDTSSSTSVQQFQLSLPSLLSRKGIVLYVVGIGPQTEDYGEIPNLVTSVGGLFKTIKLSNFSEEMASIWQDLR